jgi:hypothetical protein
MARLDITRATRIGAEVRKLLGVATFFAAASCLVAFTDKLLVWDANVTTATFTSAIVAGLVIAKVLLLVDLLPVANAVPGTPLVYTIARKAPIYVAAVLAFRYLERLIHHLVSGAGLTAASMLAGHLFTQPAFWATAIWMVVLFLVFLTARELGRVLGKDRMRSLFLGR